MYKDNNIFPVLSIKYLVNQDGEPTLLQKLATDPNLSVSNLRVLVCACVVQNTTEYVDTKVLNMLHQSKNVFVVSSFELHNIIKGNSSMYLVHEK